MVKEINPFSEWTSKQIEKALFQIKVSTEFSESISSYLDMKKNEKLLKAALKGKRKNNK